MTLQGHAKLVRIHLGEDDTWRGRPLYRVIVERCRERDIAGATVYRAVEGYGAGNFVRKRHGVVGSKDCPLVVTIIDTPDKIEAFLPTLGELVDEGLIAISSVDVIRYGAARSRP